MKRTLQILLAIISIAIINNGCKKDNTFSGSVLDVVTLNVSDVTTVDAYCDIRCHSVVDIESFGVCWSTSPKPTIDNNYNEGYWWSSGEHTILIYDLKPNTTYYARAFIGHSSGIVYGNELSFKTNAATGTTNGHSWVDLGLPSGLKWSTCNVGATTPEGYGDYYAWGETSTKSSYTSDNCTTYDVYIKEYSGNSSYDVARKKWANSWRVPTYSEMLELKNYCTWKWTTQSGVNGYKVTGPNGCSIFFPASGYRYETDIYNRNDNVRYWSSTPNDERWGCDMDLHTEDGDWEYDYARYYGQPVRPVID